MIKAGRCALITVLRRGHRVKAGERIRTSYTSCAAAFPPSAPFRCRPAVVPLSPGARILPPQTRVCGIGWWDNAARFYTRLGHSHTPSLPPINTQQLIFDGFKHFRYMCLETSCSKSSWTVPTSISTRSGGFLRCALAAVNGFQHGCCWHGRLM